MQKLRPWQNDCLSDFVIQRNLGKNLFVFEACPGAGKSRMAAELSWQMLNDEENPVDLVLVLVPWSSIQGDESNGMIQTFDIRGLRTRNRLMLRGSRIVQQPVPSNYDAIVTTYAESMCEEAIQTLDLWRSKGLKIAIIFDEIHHANELNGTWGRLAEKAQELASQTIVMSGTFFRTDGLPIKFVKYDSENKPVLSTPAFQYADGVRERVVRPVAFRFTDVELRCIDEKDGLLTRDLFSVSPNDRNIGKIMSEVFHPEGDCVRKMIFDVDDHLELTRNRFHNAGALFTCRPGRNDTSEDKHVHQIAQKIRQYTGKEVVVVTHTDKNAEGKIAAFRNSHVPYLVAVNMVSEGVDIPRLRTVAFMRYVTSEMMFRQVVGRAIRMTTDEDGTAAMAFMPRFQVMHQFALNMEKEALQGMRDLRCPECGQYPCICPCDVCHQVPCICIKPPPPPPPKRDFDILDATPFSSGGSVSDNEINESMRIIARAVMERCIHLRHANDVQLAMALQLGFPMMGTGPTSDDPKESYLKNLNNARKRVNRLMQKLAGKKYGGDFKTCWVEELMKRHKADWNTVKNTWSLFEIETLANSLEERLVEAFKNGN